MEEELKSYLDKIKIHSVKEEYIIKNYNILWKFINDNNYYGNSFSEKVYNYNNIDENRCKICGDLTKFLSYTRGYRQYCSKKCSNNDTSLIIQKNKNNKINNIKKYGVDNTSKLEYVKDKISNSKSKLDYSDINIKSKKTFIEKYGVDNPSKCNIVKLKKKKTTNLNYGVDNPFQSKVIKDNIKIKNLLNYGFEHHMMNNDIKDKVKKTNLCKYGVDNYTKTETYKNMIFEKYYNCNIKTTLNSDSNYLGYIGLGKYELICDNGEPHTYTTNSHLYHSRKNLNNKQCIICYPISKQSFKEIELYEFIKNIYKGKVISNYRDKLEIDIYLPELKIGFEFNGLYWHSELFKHKNYHLDKLTFFKNKDIDIINIWEDDWTFKQNIVKSQIMNRLQLTKTKIFARNCEIREIKDILLIKNFLNDNHIQGYVASSLKIGLYYNDELVSIMTFDHFEGRKKMEEDCWNLSRFCNKIDTNIVGGASKLLKYFIKYKNPIRIISFADKSWSNGSLYYKLGFYLKSTSYPNYSYFIDKRRINKQRYKKSNLIKMGYDINKPESKIMEDEFGTYKIFDCGQLKFELYLNSLNS